MPAIRQQMSLTEWLLVISLGIIWGGSFFFVEIAIETLHPIVVVWFRVGTAALFLWIVVLSRRYPLPTSWRVWRAFMLMGLFNNVIPFSLIVWGQVYITSGLASILNATTPLFTVIIAAFCLSDERLSKTKFIALIIGFLGVVVLFYSDNMMDIINQQLLPQLAILVAAISYGVASVFGRRFSKMNLPTAVISAGQVTASTLWMFPVFFLFTDATPAVSDFNIPVVLSLLALGLFCTALAYLIYFRILSTAGATNIVLVTFIAPISAILAGILILNEELTPNQLLGMGIIAIALLIQDGRVFKQK